MGVQMNVICKRWIFRGVAGSSQEDQEDPARQNDFEPSVCLNQNQSSCLCLLDGNRPVYPHYLPNFMILLSPIIQHSG